tara:strand:- start:230 stop:475 length:246 start_codon:yes stop_codon:yes gene_type:complete
MSTLNNDQKLRKAHKDVQNLGAIASTILTIEIADALERRVDELNESSPEANMLFTSEQAKEVLNTYLNVMNPEREKMYVTE